MASRRRFLEGTTLAVATLAGCVRSQGDTVAAAETFDGWISTAAAADGVVDATGESLVPVTVGGDDGLSFVPAAVRVDAGTTVRWRWAGGGAAHNVVAHDGSFESSTTAETGVTFERAFETPGLVKYLCVPHEYAGMTGVVVVE